MERVSVIGLGAMGSQLARVLIESGYEVTVWNRSSDKAAPLVPMGGSLAPSAMDAVKASPTVITCIRSHGDTRSLLESDPSALAGKTLVELSTGEASEAASLFDWVKGQGANCLIGMIATFPSGIGKTDSAIVTVGEEQVWKDQEAMLKALGGRSSYLGGNIAALAALFAGLFLPRQGFMFGMIYGALICEKAGMTMEQYVEQLPLTLKVVHDYFDVFAISVPSQDFSNPPSSMGTYLAAFEDVLATFKRQGVTHELPELLYGLTKRGVDAGLDNQQITALTKLLR